MKQKARLYLLFLLLTILLVSANSYAQNIGTEVLDHDLSKIEQLIIQQKYQEADSLIDRVISASKIMGQYHYFAKSYCFRGDIFALNGEGKLAYEAYYNAYIISDIIDDILVKFESLYQMGELYYTFGKKQSVSIAYIKALNYFEQCEMLDYGNRTHKYQILLNDRLANSYYKLANYSESRLYYLELYKYSRQQYLVDKEIASLEGVANSYAQLAEYDNAIEWELRLAQLYIKLQKRDLSNASYLRIANYCKKNNKIAKANEYYYLVLNSNKKTPEMELEVYYNRAKMLINSITPNYTNAESELNKAKKINTSLNDLSYKIKILNLFTLLNLRQSKFKQAVDYNNQAIENLPIEKFYIDKLMIYHTSVSLYEKQGDYENAAKYQALIIEVLKRQADEIKIESAEMQESFSKVENMESKAHENSFVQNLLSLERMRLQEKEFAHSQEKKALALERNRKLMAKEHERQILAEQLKNKELESEVEKNKAIVLKAISDAQQDSINALRYENELLSEQQQNAKLEQQRSNMLKFVLLGFGLFVLLMSFFISVRRTNKKLKEKNIVIEREHQLAEEALQKLKETQSQLLESERLASLGQLTAGIAHEIRNPLNFVNNFSKLNLELSDELKEELQEHIKDRVLLDDLFDLANIIKENNKKIYDHGERAARIVKQMLDSARDVELNVFEETNVSLLLEEAANLAYQGVRAKYLDYMADLIFDFDSKLIKVNLVQNDIGRVIINLVTNSCHATFDKQQSGDGFKARIRISTKDMGESFMIQVEDNGTGMSEEVKTKIFNPFFTTKPSGEGTGLGLTMAFDIITKLHKGSIQVESVENEFTRFTIIIPKK